MATCLFYLTPTTWIYGSFIIGDGTRLSSVGVPLGGWALDSHDTKRPVQPMVANGRRAEYVKGFIYEILDLDKSSSKELGCCVGKVKKMFLEARLEEPNPCG